MSFTMTPAVEWLEEQFEEREATREHGTGFYKDTYRRPMFSLESDFGGTANTTFHDLDLLTELGA